MILLRNTIGFFCFPQNGSVQTVLIKDSAFSNINSFNIQGSPSYNPAGTAPAPELKIEIDTCSFENSTSVAIDITNTGALKSKLFVENSVSKNMNVFFLSDVLGGVQQNRLCGNTATGGIFYTAQAGLTQSVEITEIIGNCFTGSIGIKLLPSIAWTLLDITAECNCFFGTGTGSILFDTTTSSSAGAFNGLIKAHNNTFSGFATDIQDNGSGVNYLVSRNFWGEPTNTTPCSSTSPCPLYQTCEHGSCLGPIVPKPFLGNGSIDASHPLTASIKCPCNCSFSTSGTPAP